MQLTTAQLGTLKTWVDARLAENNFQDEHQLAALVNAPASPTYHVYRTSVPMSEIMLNGFDWTRVDNLSAGKARIWEWMVEADPNGRAIDPSKLNIRAGINAVWVGTAGDLAVRAAVYAHCVRPATVAEKMFKTAGNGTAPDQEGNGPATLGPEGEVTAQNIVDAINLPQA